MRKRDELNPANRTCMNAARDDEMTFVLLARDVAAPATIRYWCEARIAMGKNRRDDDQIREALACAATMEQEREAGKVTP